MKRFEKDFEDVSIIPSASPHERNLENPNDDPTDLPPEFCVYKDEGCKLAKSCLECPFPICVDDLPEGRQKGVRAVRDKEIFRLYTEEKQTVGEIASRFNVTRRAIYASLNKVKAAGG